MDFHDIGMMQRGNKLRLPLEARDKVGVNLQIGVQQLDSNITLQLRVQGLPDLGHAALSQSLLQFVFSKTSWTRAHNYWLLGRPLRSPLHIDIYWRGRAG